MTTGDRQDAKTARIERADWPSRRFLPPSAGDSKSAVPLESASIRPARILELDALRGIACLVIVFHHLKPHLLHAGWVAVDLFFVLSGYLITAIILKNSTKPGFLLNFYVRRGLRIWPIYYLTILTVIASSPILPRECFFSGLPYLLTYTQNLPLYWTDQAPTFTPYLSHTWSLALEEQFYILWPPLVCLVGGRGTIFLALALLGGSTLARATGTHWWLLLARSDGLALGALLAAIPDAAAQSATNSYRWKRIFMGLGLTSLIFLAANSLTGEMSTLDPPSRSGATVLVVNLLAVSVVGLVLQYQGSPQLRFLRASWLVSVGTMSYGLYLYHYLFMMLSDDLATRAGLGGRPVWREALTLAVVFLVTKLSWRYVEQPVLSLKDRFNYKPGERSRTAAEIQGSRV